MMEPIEQQTAATNEMTTMNAPNVAALWQKVISRQKQRKWKRKEPSGKTWQKMEENGKIYCWQVNIVYFYFSYKNLFYKVLFYFIFY